MATPPAKYSNCSPVVESWFNWGKKPFRIPGNARRFTKDQLAIVRNSQKFLNLAMLDDRGLVKSNFAYAVLANGCACRVNAIRFSEMSKRDIKEFISVLRGIAKYCGWPREMLDIELQFLGDYR